MRLRLQIEKDDGSISKLLWGLENGHQAENMTIAELLEEINEAAGIFSYNKLTSSLDVTVDGYECLAHLTVGRLLRDGDVVSIKPKFIEDIEPLWQVPESLDRWRQRTSISQTTESISLENYANDAPPGPGGENSQMITDLIVLNPRERSPSLSSERKWHETASERSWSSVDSSDELYRKLQTCPRGEIAMNYHHDHLLHQKFPSKKRPPPRKGKCMICTRKRRFRSPNIQRILAFAEECFYCTIILAVVRSQSHETSLSAKYSFSWWRDPWYDFQVVSRFSPLWARNEHTPILFVLSDDENHYHDLPVGNATAANTGSEEAFLKALVWIRDCLVSHDRCDKNSRVALPSRVLDLEATDSEDGLKLHESIGDVGCYVSLSHCWGDSDYPAKTTSHTLAQNKKSILWFMLPKTFQDAIVFTRWLGIRYLWIDSLCIIQDSEEDWLEESVKMVDVYQKAYVTIAATASRSDDGGLFYAKKPEELTKRLFGLASDGTPFNMYLRSRFLHDRTGKLATYGQYKDVPLLTRAWAYQEILLSPRVLHFGKQELRWECMERMNCECGEDDTQKFPSRFYNPYKLHHSSALANGRDKAVLHSRWQAIVEEYSALGLTFGKDKLPALSGLANQMRRYRPADKYIGGLWLQSLFQDMLWTVDRQRSCTLTSVSGLCGKWRAPTWSWASNNRPVRYMWHMRGTKMRRSHAKLVDVTVESASMGDETGGLLGAEMVLDGKLIPGVWYDRLYPAYSVVCPYLRLASTGIPAYDVSLDNFQDPETYVHGYRYEADLPHNWEKTTFRDRPSYIITGMDNEAMCLPLMEFKASYPDLVVDHYLLINKIKTQDNGQDVYRRLGIFTLRREGSKQFPYEDWPVTRFTFI